MDDGDDSFPRRTGWLSLVAALTVAVAFLLVTLVTQSRAQTIDRLANALEANAMPSIDHLTAARGALRRVTLGLRDFAADPIEKREQDRQAIEGAKQKLDEEMGAYVELPSFPGERARGQVAAKDLGVFERIVDAVIARAVAQDLDGARRIMIEELTLASDKADGDIEGLVRLNADEARRTSYSIQQARLHATTFSYLLHALAGTLVLFVVLAVARASRSYERLVEERARLTSERKQFAERRAAEARHVRCASGARSEEPASRARVESQSRRSGTPSTRIRRVTHSRVRRGRSGRWSRSSTACSHSPAQAVK